MFYLATQTFFFILLAFAFGVWIGWLLRRSFFGSGASTAAASRPSTVVGDALLDAQRRLTACQQSLAQAEARLQEMETRPARQPAPQTVTAGTKATVAKATTTRDNLKLIFGIGPVIERKLAEIDITTFKQIAHLTPGEIDRVGEHLDYFPGRIERDGWLESARKLHRDKYGEEA